MNVKIDTKEKFNVIYPEEKILSANMSAPLRQLLLSYLKNDPPHVIVNLKNVETADSEIYQVFVEMHEIFYSQNASILWCEINETISSNMEKIEKLDCINHTPTESEAWDIIQMEEIERELLKDF